MGSMYHNLMHEDVPIINQIWKQWGNVYENAIHASRDCSMVHKVWENRGPASIMHAFYGSNLQEWINLNIKNIPQEDREWCNYWVMGCHMI